MENIDLILLAVLGIGLFVVAVTALLMSPKDDNPETPVSHFDEKEWNKFVLE